VNRLDEVDDALITDLLETALPDETPRGFKDIIRDYLPTPADFAKDISKWTLCEAMNRCSPPYQIWPKRELVDKINENK
jgi:hypothetical protein